MATSVTGVLGVILGLGTRNYLVREIVILPTDAPSLIGTAIVLRLLLLPVFAASVIAYAHFAHLGPDAASILYLMAGACFLGLVIEPIQAGFQAVEQMEYLAYYSVANSTIGTTLSIGLAVLGLRALGLTASTLAVAVVMVLLSAHWARPSLPIVLRTNMRRLRHLVRESLAYWVFGVFFMVYLWIDSVMLSLMAPSAVVGWYGVATKIFTTLMFLPTILATAWLPRLVSAFGEGMAQLRVVARVPVSMVVILSLPLCVAAAMTANPVIHLLYGPSYRPAQPVMAILALCLPPMYLNIMLNQVLVAEKRQAVWSWVMAMATIVNPILNLFLIHFYQRHYHNGAIGAAISLVITELLVVAAGMVLVGHHVLDGPLVWKMIRAGFAALGMAIVMYFTKPSGFVVAWIAGGVSFAVLAILFRVTTMRELRAGTGAVTRWWRSRHQQTQML
jgi:O-antigen/teichoic acid export membrane protein